MPKKIQQDFIGDLVVSTVEILPEAGYGGYFETAIFRKSRQPKRWKILEFYSCKHFKTKAEALLSHADSLKTISSELDRIVSDVNTIIDGAE